MLFSKPDQPTSTKSCSDALGPIKAERGAKVTESEEYGTGAVVDTVFEGFEKVAVAWVEAIRSENCKAAYVLFVPGGRFGSAGETGFCDNFDANFTDQPEGLGSRLQKDPDAEPEPLGAPGTSRSTDWPPTPPATERSSSGASPRAGHRS